MIYLIRTDKIERKTYIISIGNSEKKDDEISRVENPKRIGLIYSDFLLYPDSKDLLSEEIIDSVSEKPIARLNVYEGNYAIRLTLAKKNRELASLDKNWIYRENGSEIPMKKIPKTILLKKSGYEKLENSGLLHAYILGEKSSLEKVFCYEKDGDVSGVVYTKGNDIGLDTPLKGLALVLAKRIEEQEFIFGLLRG